MTWPSWWRSGRWPTPSNTRPRSARRLPSGSSTPSPRLGCRTSRCPRLRTAAWRCTATSLPDGAPTVLLYSHYDVQPPLGEDAWTSPVWELTERDGRWYGRGAADCKGNIVMHLTALRALKQLDGGFPCGVKIICEGSEEQGTGGLEAFVPENAELLRADTILVVDTGNFAVGDPHPHDHVARHDECRYHASRARQRDALGHVRRAGAGPGRSADPAARRRSTTRRATRPSTGSTTSRAGAGWTIPRSSSGSDANVLEGVEADGRGHRRGDALGAPVGHRAGD